jgi:hypothetical protein
MTLTTTRASNFDALTRAAHDSFALELARLTLATGVPIEISHLKHQEGGPYDYQIEAAQAFIKQQALDEAIQFASKNTGSHMQILIEILAIMAFHPGGVSCFGLHWEAESEVTA